MKHTKNVLISVVVPAYNESKRILRTLASLRNYFKAVDYGYEVIVVSDGSKDVTDDIVRDFASLFPALRLISYGKNRGKGYAVKQGMLAARGEYRLFMDADNSVTIESVETLLDEMERSGSDVAIGSIGVPGSVVVEGAGAHRRILGSLSKLLVRAVALPGIYDTQRGFKLFTKRAADAIFPLQRIERFGFDIEVLLIARRHGFKIKEVPVDWYNPAGSKVTAKAYLDSLVDLGKTALNAASGKYDLPAPDQKSARDLSGAPSLVQES